MTAFFIARQGYVSGEPQETPRPRLHKLNEDLLIDRIVGVHGVKAALIATTDGLLIFGSGGDMDFEATAAETTALMQTAARMGQAHGQPLRLSIETGSNVTILEALDEDVVLAVIFHNAANVSYVRYLLDERRNRVPATSSAR